MTEWASQFEGEHGVTELVRVTIAVLSVFFYTGCAVSSYFCAVLWCSLLLPVGGGYMQVFEGPCGKATAVVLLSICLCTDF